MKKFNFILVMLFALLMVACNRDTETPQQNGSLVGTWNLTGGKINGTMTAMGMSIPYNDELPMKADCEGKSFGVFNADGTGRMEVYFSGLGTSCSEFQKSDFTYTYDASTKIITLKMNGETQTSKVVKLTDTELVTEQNLTNFNIDAGIISGTFSGKIESRYKKK